MPVSNHLIAFNTNLENTPNTILIKKMDAENILILIQHCIYGFVLIPKYFSVQFNLDTRISAKPIPDEWKLIILI